MFRRPHKLTSKLSERAELPGGGRELSLSSLSPTYYSHLALSPLPLTLASLPPRPCAFLLPPSSKHLNCHPSSRLLVHRRTLTTSLSTRRRGRNQAAPAHSTRPPRPQHIMALSRSRDASICDLGALAAEPQKTADPSFGADLTRSLQLVSMLVLAFAGSAVVTFASS